MADEPIPLKPNRRQARRCPVCGRPPWPEQRPFCSRRCREVDLARWFAGVYRIDTDEGPAEAADPSGREQG